MVTIKLTNGYYIEKEGIDHVLKRTDICQPKDKTKAPHTVERNLGYFANTKQALGRYLDLVQTEGLDGRSYEMSEYARAIKDFNDATIEEIIKLVGA